MTRDPGALRLLDGAARGALVPFLDQPDKRWFFAPHAWRAAGAAEAWPQDGALVVYGAAGRVLVALGGPIGEPEAAWRGFDAFRRAAAARRLIVGVYQADEDAAMRLVERGFRVVPVGGEAIVELAEFGLSGSRRANLRHTITRARRGGVQVEWHPDGLPAADVEAMLPALLRMDRQWRASAGPPMGFTISRFTAASVTAPAAVALAVDEARRPTAFATFRRTGVDGGYVLDLLRREPGGVPGSLESCVAAAAEALRDAGVPTLSLGLAPLAGLRPTGPTVEERVLARAAALVEPMYDVAGLAFFKDKFGARWETRYLAARNAFELAAVAMGLLRLHLVPPGGSIRGVLTEAIDGLLPSPPEPDEADTRNGRARPR